MSLTVMRSIIRLLRICCTGSSPRLGKAELDWECHRLATLHFTNLLILETSRPCKLLPDEHPPAPPGARLDVIVSRQTPPAGVDIRGLPLLERAIGPVPSQSGSEPSTARPERRGGIRPRATRRWPSP